MKHAQQGASSIGKWKSRNCSSENPAGLKKEFTQVNDKETVMVRDDLKLDSIWSGVAKESSLQVCLEGYQD